MDIDAIELHLRSYRSALKSNLEVAISSLTHSFERMQPILSGADAFKYASLRLPECIAQTKLVILGQNPGVFEAAGFKDIPSWTPAPAPARRRVSYFDPKTGTLAVFIASISDVDDIVNLLIAYQLEYNKTNSTPLDLHLRLLAGSWVDYTKNIQKWYKTIAQTVSDRFHLSRQQIYFVSGQNDFLKTPDTTSIPSSDFLDVNVQILPVSKISIPKLKITHPKKLSQSTALIFNIDYPLGFTAYHILKELLENVTKIKGVYILGKSAVLNSAIGDIQIPRVVFDEHTQNTYLFHNAFNSFFPCLDKTTPPPSPTSPCAFQGSVLTNQKAVSTLGTFLENQALIDKYSESDFTIVEMESGPYLQAITEATYSDPIPKNAIVDLNPAPFDIGIINYTSDTPYTQAYLSTPLPNASLAAASLGSLTILQRIIDLEEK
ncbi:hypothetical protein A3K55_00205 [Candidatus Shapirobacteria bacterium RBG_13_44_7]|uniref:Uncharacterized protein n=1 Tax=Candidatus Shapirobacteria bacterium RBG_13_44_7 TaxID=1802149 RepID=A0A1F7SEM5_9BACT|nr:MAG: hypothetical protein A3K55_00205 [Candidatus Shapirobacteria bacterium RBG_13_44_7]